MALYTNMAFKQAQGKVPFKYLSVAGDKGSLEYVADGVVQQGTKFAIENAPGNLVHIRSCENNKYWVRDANNLIVAQALVPEADRKSPGCTLFSIRTNEKRTTFLHVQSGRVVGLNSGMALSIDPTSPIQAVSTILDYDGLVILPKFVAFKGSNDLYYRNGNKGNFNFAGFNEREIGSLDIVCECEYSTDGHLFLKIVNSRPGQKSLYWTAVQAGANPLPTDKALVGGSPGNPSDVRQMFQVIRVANNVIALRSRLNNLICMRANFNSLSNRLVAQSHGMVKDAYLEIVEPVFKRTVTVFEFNLDRARIYNTELLYSDDHVWENPSDETQSGTADGRIITNKSSTYTNNITVSATVTTTFETGIPFIAQGKLEVSASASYSHEWAHTKTEEQQVGHIFTVVVVPWKRTRARGTATKAKCDVPFAYVQRDYPTDGGPPRVTRLHDGVFTGANAYSFHSEVRYEDLPPQNGRAPNKCIKYIVPHK